MSCRLSVVCLWLDSRETVLWQNGRSYALSVLKEKQLPINVSTFRPASLTTKFQMRSPKPVTNRLRTGSKWTHPPLFRVRSGNDVWPTWTTGTKTAIIRHRHCQLSQIVQNAVSFMTPDVEQCCISDMYVQGGDLSQGAGAGWAAAE